MDSSTLFLRQFASTTWNAIVFALPAVMEMFLTLFFVCVIIVFGVKAIGKIKKLK